MNNQEKQMSEGQSYQSVYDKESGMVTKSSVSEKELYTNENKKPRLHISIASDGIGTNSDSKMTSTKKVTHSIQQDVSVFNIPSRTILDRQRESSSKQDDAENITSVTHVVDRICESSVASDVSGLTDGEFFKTDDFSTPFVTTFNMNKIFRSVVRAPEPPTVSPGTSKLTDIQSETTTTTTSSSSEGNLVRKMRSVSFCEVQIRNYNRCLEVNPSVTSGPAVGIGWNYSAEEDEIFSLEMFEETREHSRRSSMQELALPRHKREALLRNWGYSQRDIAWSVRSILRSKNQRKQTIQNLHASNYEELMEKATRKMKNVLLFPLNKSKRDKQPYVYPPQILSTKKTSLVQST